MTPDLIERCARAIYDARPLIRSQIRTYGETGATTDIIDIPWCEVIADAESDAVCRGVVVDVRKAAAACLTEAVAWLTEGVKSREGDEGNSDAAVWLAIKRMEHP